METAREVAGCAESDGETTTEREPAHWPGETVAGKLNDDLNERCTARFCDGATLRQTVAGEDVRVFVVRRSLRMVGARSWARAASASIASMPTVTGGPGGREHVLRRTLQPDHAHGDAPPHAADQWVLQEAGEPHSLAEPLLRALHYNFCRVHEGLQMSPAMAAGVSDTLRDMEWIVGLIDSRAPKPKRPATYRRREISN